MVTLKDSIAYADELNLKLTIEHYEKFDDLCRKVTSTDVSHALSPLKLSEKSDGNQTIYSDNETSTILPESECGCCRLLRSSRSALPLARRGRPHISTRSHRLLCSNCTEIKRKQQIDILQNQEEKLNSTTIINLDISSEENRNQMMSYDIPHEIEFSLINQQEKTAINNGQYQSTETLVWKINTSDDQNQLNTIDISYDTGSLTSEEKKTLLDETIKKLKIVLENPSITIADNDRDNIEFTYRALQTTVNILSSSLNSI